MESARANAGATNKLPCREDNTNAARLHGCKEALHPAGNNPGDIIAERHLDSLKRVVLDEYAQCRRQGKNRFSGKHNLLEQSAAHFRVVLNGGRARNSAYSIINKLRIPADQKQLLRNWWHDHSSHPLGCNPGDFWKISTRPFPDAHFAVYPEALCELPIKAACPEAVCLRCGQAWMKPTSRNPRRQRSCDCNAGSRPGIVFDPFAGAGTTLVVAKKLGRLYMGCDLNPEYVRIARERLRRVHESAQSSPRPANQVP
jgi:hypothetical protein